MVQMWGFMLRVNCSRLPLSCLLNLSPGEHRRILTSTGRQLMVSREPGSSCLSNRSRSSRNTVDILSARYYKPPLGHHHPHHPRCSPPHTEPTYYFDSLSLKASLIDNYDFDRFFLHIIHFFHSKIFLLSITMEA